MKIALLLVALFVAGCAGTYFTFDQARQVKVGMTRAEIIKVMGKPMIVSTTATNEIWNYTFADGFGHARMVQFALIDGKVNQVPIIPDTFSHGSPAQIQTASP